MKKTNICVSIDYKNYIELKKRRLNVSQTVDNLLNTYFSNVSKKDSSNDLESKESEIMAYKIQVTLLESELQKFKEAEEKRKLERKEPEDIDENFF